MTTRPSSALTALAGILLVIPAFIVATMLLVAMPACVVDISRAANWRRAGSMVVTTSPPLRTVICATVSR